MSYRRILVVTSALLFAATAPAGADDALLVSDIETSGQGWTEDRSCEDICPPPPVLHGSQPEQLTPVGDRLFFSAFDFEHGRELWVTDGTAGGSRLVADLCPGACHANPWLLGALKGELVLWASDEDETPGRDPFGHYWVTDGTPAGTRRLDGICDGPCHGGPQSRGLPFDSSLLFIAAPAEGFGGYPVLWRTDATSAGTRPVLQAADPPAPAAPLELKFLTTARLSEDTLLLVQESRFDRPDRPAVLYRLRAGEEMPQRVVAGCSAEDTEPNRLVATSGRVAFVSGCLDRAGLRTEGPGLFLTDGTAGGTSLLYDGGETPGGSRWPAPLGWVGDELWFAVNDGDADSAELWTSDGTAGGTARRIGGLPRTTAGFVLAGRVVLWVPGDGQAGLWVTDGTAGGTLELVAGGVRELTVLGHVLLFSALDEAGREPWMSDGTQAGTRRLVDLNPGPADSSPRGFAAGDRVYFSADDGVHDREPWVFPRSVVKPRTCLAGGDVLCLADGRFAVRVRFRNQHAGGAEGVGTAVPGTPRTGFFWFFREDNLELMVKVLDGTAVNGHHWVFYGGITDIEYALEVTDVENGETRTYHHPPGDLCGGSDTRAFPAAAGEPLARSVMMH